VATLPTRKLRPEEEELERKKAELAQLEVKLADRELELATLAGELTTFERNYLKLVGKRYADLDALESEIAELKASQRPADKSARAEAETARNRARESAETARVVEESPQIAEFTSSDSLKKLYREAAKLLHPDLTTDEVEKARRHKLMTEVNQAYARGDEERIRAILREWESSPEQVRGEGPGVELVRVIRKLHQVASRLATIDREMDELRGSDLFQLKSKVEQAAQEGRDFLTEMATDLDAQVAKARERLNDARREAER